jgi:peptidoglycan/xylan/chitin deacetylase (PgdA/CDA1 family)
MLTLTSLRSAPIALANWAGLRAREEKPAARILLFHGTPRREAAALERILRWIKGRFQIAPLRAVVAAAANGEATLRPKVALSFDDGLRSNVTVAYPLLHRLAIPATFFVCPGLVDRGAWLWTHEARARLQRLSPGARSELAKEWRAPGEPGLFREWMKTLDTETRRRVEARIREASPRFSPSAPEREDSDVATWADLRRLDPAIVGIGSHSLTHPILPATAPEELEAEVGDSRRLLERGLQRPVDFFAYPNGDYDSATEACVRRHYRAALTVEERRVPRDADPLRLPRLAAPPGVLRLARRIYL